MQLLEANLFDTIYHEHFSYFSLLTAERVFAAHGLPSSTSTRSPTHGGSLRLYLEHAERGNKPSERGRGVPAARGAGWAGLARPRTPASASGSRR